MAKWFDSIRKRKKAPMTLEAYILAQEVAKELTKSKNLSDLWRNEVWQRKW